MSRCDFCGNSDVRLFRVVTKKGATYRFDTFRCAMQVLVPTCKTCGRRLRAGRDGGAFATCGGDCAGVAAGPRGRA